jgi:hypothetical protein
MYRPVKTFNGGLGFVHTPNIAMGYRMLSYQYAWFTDYLAYSAPQQIPRSKCTIALPLGD